MGSREKEILHQLVRQGTSAPQYAPLEHWTDAVNRLERENAALRARVEKLARDLKKYGAHRKDCGLGVTEFGIPVFTYGSCTCGLAAALAECEEVGK